MKSKILITLLCVVSLSLSSQTPTNGLIAFFPFSGNANDSSINHTHGTPYNVTLTTNRFGKPNSAYEFSGNSNSYIEFPSTYLINDRYTYSLWAKINSIPSEGEMAFALNVGSDGGDQSINIANNYGSFNGWLGGGYNTTTPSFALNEDQSLSTTGWTHVLCVRDSSFALLYVNGVLVDSLGANVKKYPYYGSSIVKATIGRRNGGSGAFDGKIDDICIYNRALSKKEITDLYIDQYLSVAEISKKAQKMVLYPDPSNGVFSMDLKHTNLQSNNIKVSISNILGQVVYNQDYVLTNNILEINSQLNNGQYLVSIFDEQNNIIAREKILIQD
jgi:hypothetical protein